MIRIGFASDEHVPVRVVVSPFLNVVVCLLELFLDAEQVWNRRWQELVRERARGLDLEPLAFMRSGRELPDALAPLPHPPGATFDEELALVRVTPPPVVRADVQSVYEDEVDPVARR